MQPTDNLKQALLVQFIATNQLMLLKLSTGDQLNKALMYTTEVIQGKRGLE